MIAFFRFFFWNQDPPVQLIDRVKKSKKVYTISCQYQFFIVYLNTNYAIRHFHHNETQIPIIYHCR
jgi:hypothetical protein